MYTIDGTRDCATFRDLVFLNVVYLHPPDSATLSCHALCSPALMRYNSHPINAPLKVYSSVVFSMFTESGSHHHSQLWNIFVTSEGNLRPISSHSRLPLSRPRVPETTHRLPVSGFAYFGCSLYTESHNARLTPSTRHNAFEAHPWSSGFQDFTRLQRECHSTVWVYHPVTC